MADPSVRLVAQRTASYPGRLSGATTKIVVVDLAGTSWTGHGRSPRPFVCQLASKP